MNTKKVNPLYIINYICFTILNIFFISFVLNSGYGCWKGKFVPLNLIGS